MSILDNLTPEQREAALKEATAILESQKTTEKAERLKYKELASEEVESLFGKMKQACAALKEVKSTLYNSLQAIIASKAEVFNVKEGQKTHTITTLDGSKRITVGYRDVSDWDGTETAGIEKVQQHLKSLAKDEASSQLVGIISGLLKPDKKGQLDPRRIMELKKHAEATDNHEFSDGVNIIMNAYKMVKSKAILLVEERVEGSWRNVELDFSDIKVVSEQLN